jgi:hypothetical protein
MYVKIAIRTFYIGRLEYWWVAFNKVEFYPEGRKHLRGGWFWRLNNKQELI